MSDAPDRPDPRTQGLVFDVPSEGVALERDLAYGDGDDRFDLYRPAQPEADPPPLVVLVPGYADAGLEAVLGCGFREMAQTRDWARLLAGAGLAAAVPSATEPASAIAQLLDHVRSKGTQLGVDAERIGLWSCSGNAPTALAVFMSGRPELRCAVLAYALTLDLDGADEVAAAATQFGFANAAAGRGAADLPADRPLLLVRAGRDEIPGLNVALDRLVAAALDAGRPLRLLNHASAPHAFDLVDDSAATRAVIAEIVAFLCAHLAGG